VPDQRSLLRGRLASAIDDVADVASHLGPQVTKASAPSPPPPPLQSVGRPWTLAAAMEPISPPAAVERGASAQATMPSMAPEPPALEHHRSRLHLAVIGSGLLGVALIAVVAIHLLDVGAGVQPPAHPSAQITLTDVRPLASAASADGVVPATQVSFPPKTSVVDIEVGSGRAAGDAPVQIAVALGDPAQTITNNAYVLNQSGSTVIPLTPPTPQFAAGEYTVTITYRGALLGSTEFSIQ
jgi:hypothetical protein